MSEDGNEDDVPPQMPNLTAYFLRELVEVKASMAVLDATVQAQAQIINALAVAVPASKRPDVLALLRAQQQMLSSDGENTAAGMLGVTIDYIGAMLGEGGKRTLGEVTAAVGLGNALVRSVPEEYAQAMRTWLSIATEGEIAQDATRLPPEQLDELLRLQAASEPVVRGGSKKRKPRGGG
ncbi:hypothetical protein ACNQFN_11430 [Thauera butanivorans]|uniref:hypothetical protein n=1 Tax=Thauera butanivorans TaxID=86174 RepID=UPI003AB2AB45